MKTATVTQRMCVRYATAFILACIGIAQIYAIEIAKPYSENVPRVHGFIKNNGQWPEHVLFGVRQRGANVWITTQGVTVDEYSIEGSLRKGRVQEEAFTGSARQSMQSCIMNSGSASTSVVFCKGTSTIITQSYAGIRCADVVPGVDAIYAIDQDGRVQRTLQATSPSKLQQLRTRIYGSAHEHVQEITPSTSIVYGAYIGGPQADVLAGIEILTNGEVVVTGSTTELSFPTTLGGYKNAVKGGIDAFIMRCDAKLQRVLTYTYYGGTSDDRVRDITVDASNNVYICGETTSNDLPTSNSATSRTYKTGIDAFAAKFDSTLTKLLTGFYHGGNRDDVARGIAVDDNGTIVIAGSTTSTVNLPNTMPATAALSWTFYPMMGNPEPITVTITSGRTNTGSTDGFVATFSGSGIMQQSRYYGKEGVDYFTAVAFDKSSNVYLTGSTTSTNFETVPVANAKWSGRLPYDRTYNGGTTDAFVVKFNSNLTYSQTDGITFSTFLGGNKDEEARSIEVDALGRIYITGVTTSTNLPAIGTLATLNMGLKDAFYAQFGADGGDITGCTYFGGSGNDELIGARLVPNSSNVLIYGSTQSADFPLEGQGARSERVGATDGFLSVINLGALSYSTLVVGSQTDTVVGAIADKLGDPFYAVNTTSNDLRTHDSSFAKTSEGLSGYVAKLAFGILELSSPTGGETVCVGGTRSISWSALGMADTTKFRIEYSPAGTGTWKDVVKSVGGRSYSWKVPALPNGPYVLRVSTIHGHVSELITPFTVSNPPSITSQPKNASACPGQPVTLSVSASGSGLKFQWRRAGVNIPNATDSTYTIASLDATSLGKYDCLVSGLCTPNATSQSATVSSATPTEITKQPQTNVTVTTGSPFTLSITAGGSDLTYQWFKNGSAITGATTAQYTVASAAKSDEGLYTCEVTGGCGKVTSSAATVVVEGGTSVDDDNLNGAAVRVLGPQPSSDNVSLFIELSAGEHVSLRMMDMRSNVVVTQEAGMLAAGQHTLSVPVSTCAAGCYILEVQMGPVRTQRSIIIQR